MHFTGCKETTLNAPPVTPTPTPTPTTTPAPVVKIKELPITLPLLDALFFVDRKFSERLKTDLQLSDEQIAQIRQTVRAETASLRESEADDDPGRTAEAGERAKEKISAIVGAEKAQQLADLALERWRVGSETDFEEQAQIPLASPTLTAALEAPGVPSPSPALNKGEPIKATASSASYSAPADRLALFDSRREEPDHDWRLRLARLRWDDRSSDPKFLAITGASRRIGFARNGDHQIQ